MLIREILEARGTLSKVPFYHGTPTVFANFDLDFIGKGTDQEGPGFYFSNDIKTALGYASGAEGRILDCRLTPRRLIRSRGQVDDQFVRDLILKSPNKDDTLMNFDENPTVALRSAINAMIVRGDPKETYERVWFDFYRHDAKLWAQHLIAHNIDGIFVPQQTGSDHVIMFNPDRIKIVDVIDAETAGQRSDT